MYLDFNNEYVILIIEVLNDKIDLVFNFCWNIYCEMLIFFYFFKIYVLLVFLLSFKN